MRSVKQVIKASFNFNAKGKHVLPFPSFLIVKIFNQFFCQYFKIKTHLITL